MPSKMNRIQNPYGASSSKGNNLAFFIPAIMAIGSAMGAGGGAAAGAAGAGAATAAGTAAAGTAAAAGAAGTAAGTAGAVGAGAGAGVAGTAGGVAGGASMPAAGGAAVGAGAKPVSLVGKVDSIMNRPDVKIATSGGSALMGAVGKDTGVPSNQPGTEIQNPIPQMSSSINSPQPNALMPGAMDTPFGSPSQRAFSDTLSRKSE